MRECQARLGFYRFFRAARASFSLLLISSQVRSFSISPPKSLGDVLYQIMIHCEIEKEQGNFTIDDVVNGICEKMVRRHPRLFGGEMEKDLTWEEIKRREKEARAARKNR